jgi:hypothetical protein
MYKRLIYYLIPGWMSDLPFVWIADGFSSDASSTGQVIHCRKGRWVWNIGQEWCIRKWSCPI